MAKPKSVQAYEKEIVKMIEARNGVVSGSMGQEKREPHPLLAVYDKMQRTLLQQYAALGLNYNATPSKINEPTGKAAKEDDPLVKFYSGFMDIRDTTPDGEPK